ncbi:MAG: hypothetical protein M3P30_03270 [Chloroflexota bacterium]|nr:hypothetical protein [Chloroflexota bacterium]
MKWMKFGLVSIHKDAGVEKSVVLVTSMLDLPALPPVDPASVPNPATADDKAFTMVHLMRFKERATDASGKETPLSGRDAIARYEQAVGLAALPLGIRPAAVLEVEAVLIGDGRAWDEVRLNHFPSHGAFAALSANADGGRIRPSGLVPSPTRTRLSRCRSSIASLTRSVPKRSPGGVAGTAPARSC